MLGLTVPTNDPMFTLRDDVNSNYQDGFITMVKRAGIPVVVYFINAIMVTAALSAAAGDIYVVVTTNLLFPSILIGNTVHRVQRW